MPECVVPGKYLNVSFTILWEGAVQARLFPAFLWWVTWDGTVACPSLEGSRFLEKSPSRGLGSREWSLLILLSRDELLNLSLASLGLVSLGLLT